LLERAQPSFEEPPVPPPDRAGTAEDEPQQRATPMVQNVRRLEDLYRTKISPQEVTRESSVTLGGAWEICDLVLKATDEVATAIETLPRRIIESDDPFGGPA
jgi:hypothetical protein